MSRANSRSDHGMVQISRSRYAALMSAAQQNTQLSGNVTELQTRLKIAASTLRGVADSVCDVPSIAATPSIRQVLTGGVPQSNATLLSLDHSPARPVDEAIAEPVVLYPDRVVPDSIDALLDNTESSWTSNFRLDAWGGQPRTPESAFPTPESILEPLPWTYPWTSNDSHVRPTTGPSRYCHDILSLEGMVRFTRAQEYANPDLTNPPQSLDALIVKMLHLLTSPRCQPHLRLFYEETLTYDRVGPLTRWRIEPTPENYHKLPRCYRPSTLQLTRPHWPIIDWWPYPGLRDKTILHADKYDLREISDELHKYFCLEDEEVIEDFQGDHDPRTGPRTSTIPDGNRRHDPASMPPFIQPRAPPPPPPPAQLSTTATPITESTNPFSYSSPSSRPTRRVFYSLQEYLDFIRRKPSPSSWDLFVRRDLPARFMSALQNTDEAILKIDPAFYAKFPDLYVEDEVARGVRRSIFVGIDC